jgi:predicted nucleic acid-binding protein
MGIVIDTSALVALERSGSDWARLLTSNEDEPVALPAIIYAETAAWSPRTTWPWRRRR